MRLVGSGSTPQDSELSLTEQASLAGVSRSSLYYRPVGISEEEIWLRHRIDQIYTQYAFYGSRKMAITLQKEGFHVGRKRVQTAMREMGIEGIHPGPNLSKRVFSTGSIRTFSGSWFPALPTMSGGSMSPIFGSSTDGCIWWPPSTGIRGMSFPGSLITPWRCPLFWTVWTGRSLLPRWRGFLPRWRGFLLVV